MGQTRSIIIGLALVLGQTGAAYAADLGLLPPPPLDTPAPCVGCSGPWYFRGFVGGANPMVGDISSELFQFNDFQVFHKDIKSSPFVGGGIGYEFNSWLRFDVIGEYRGDATFFGQDRYPGSDGFNNVGPEPAPGAFNPGTNEYTADIQSWVGLANAYINLGTYHCITLYVGGGVGFATISVNASRTSTFPSTACSMPPTIRRRTSPGASMGAFPMT